MGRPKNPKMGGKVESSAELRNHVFGPADGLAIAKSFVQSLKIMQEVCGFCGLKPQPKKPFVWAFVSAVTPKNRLSRKGSYIVQLKDLAGGHSVTVNVGDGEGGDRLMPFCVQTWIVRDFEPNTKTKAYYLGNDNSPRPEDEDEVNVFTLAYAWCYCSLKAKFTTGQLTIPDVGHLEKWSSSDHGEYDAEDRDFIEEGLKRNYPALYRATYAQKAKEKQLALAEKSSELEEEEHEARGAGGRRPADLIAASRKGRQGSSSTDDGYLSGVPPGVSVEKVRRAKTASPAQPQETPPALAEPRKSSSAGANSRRPAPGLNPIVIHKSAEEVRVQLGDFMTPSRTRTQTASEKAASEDEDSPILTDEESPMERRFKANLKADDEARQKYYDEEEEEEREELARSKKEKDPLALSKVPDTPLIPSDNEDVHVIDESPDREESGSESSGSSKSSVSSSREWKPRDHGKSESAIRREKLEREKARSKEKREANKRRLDEKDLRTDPKTLPSLGRSALESRQKGRRLIDTLNAIPDEVYLNANPGDTVQQLVEAAVAVTTTKKGTRVLAKEMARLEQISKASMKPIGLHDPEPLDDDDERDEEGAGGQGNEEAGVGEAEGEEEGGEEDFEDDDDADAEPPEMPPVDVEVMIVEGEEGDVVYEEARESDFPSDRGDLEIFEVEGGELPPVPTSFHATEEENDEREKTIKATRSTLIKKLGGIGRDIVRGMNELKMFSDATIETAAQVREDLLRVAHLGGQALESDEITETEETVKRLGDKFQEMADGVVRVKSTYVDAMINWGVQLMHYQDIADQVAAIKRILDHEFLYHEVLRGGDLNVDNPYFQENLTKFCSLAFRHPDEPDVDDSDYVKTMTARVKTFVERDNRKPLKGGSIQFPEFCFEAADQWNGNHLIDLPRKFCEPREVPENECQKVIGDTRVLPYDSKEAGRTKTVESERMRKSDGELYRYIHGNVWFRQRHVWRLWVALCRVPKKYQTFYSPGDSETDSIRTKFRKVVQVMCEILFDGGMMGGEYANCYKEHLHPLTRKKIDAVKRLLKYFLSLFVHMGLGTPTDFEHTVDLIMSSFYRFAGKQRVYRVAEFSEEGVMLTKGARTPYLVKVEPGKPVKPGYYVRHYSEEANRRDTFVSRFVDSPLTYTDEFKQSRDRIKTRGNRVVDEEDGEVDSPVAPPKKRTARKKNSGGWRKPYVATFEPDAIMNTATVMAPPPSRGRGRPPKKLQGTSGLGQGLRDAEFVEGPAGKQKSTVHLSVLDCGRPGSSVSSTAVNNRRRSKADEGEDYDSDESRYDLASIPSLPKPKKQAGNQQLARQLARSPMKPPRAPQPTKDKYGKAPREVQPPKDKNRKGPREEIYNDDDDDEFEHEQYIRKRQAQERANERARKEARKSEKNNKRRREDSSGGDSSDNSTVESTPRKERRFQ